MLKLYGRNCASERPYFLRRYGQKVERLPLEIKSGRPFSFSKLSRPDPGCAIMTCGSFWKIEAMVKNGAFSRT